MKSNLNKWVTLSLFLGIFLVQTRWISAEKIADLPDILKPESFILKGDKGYIAERKRIFIISLDTGKVIKSFGKQGEGPGEFKGRPQLTVYPDYLVVNSWGKIMYFSHTGEYLRQQSHQLGHHPGALPIKDGFAGQKSGYSEKDRGVTQSFGIYDKDFKLVKQIFEAPNLSEYEIRPGQAKQPYYVIKDYIGFQVYNDKVFVADSRKGLFFKVFDHRGQWLYDIRVPTTPVTISRQVKERELANLERQAWWAHLKDRFTPQMPESYPEIRHFLIIDKKIYILTYQEKGGECLMKILDLQGKTLGTIFVPAAMEETRALYGIDNNRYYYLKDNEESETWELHAARLEY